MNSDNVVDLSIENGPNWGEFSDDEDEEAFSDNWDLYESKVWKLRHNDPNFGLVYFTANDLKNHKTRKRIGRYLCSTKHVKTLRLIDCGLRNSKMKELFGEICQQHVTNEYLVSHNIVRKILGNAGVYEGRLVDKVLEGAMGLSFKNLTNLDISRNKFGTGGLDLLVKALAGSPIEYLTIQSCRFDSISPLQGLQKCLMLERLDISYNPVGLSGADTIVNLLGKGFPKLLDLRLNGCNINDEVIEMIAPALLKNKTLRYLSLTNERHQSNSPSDNTIGERGISALEKALHDRSSFKNTLQSNHHMYKIILPEIVVWHSQNIRHENPNNTAMAKYVEHLADSEDVDTAPLTEIEPNLIPNVLARLNTVCDETQTITALYKLVSNKAVQERIQTAREIGHLQSRNAELNTTVESLKDENAKLKQQIANLLAKNDAAKVSGSISAGSIAERVKRKRSNSRKRTRKG